MLTGLSGSLVASQVGVPFPTLTGPPEGELRGCPDLDPGFQRWVSEFSGTQATGDHPARPAAQPAALHGMIWMTLAFFMLAGRLPVLMFSFMIRTLVSFCGQGGQSRW